MTMKTLAERLRWAREKAGYSQARLAREAGIKQQSVSPIERGDVQKSAYVAIFARILGVDSAWLSEGIGQPYPQENATKSSSGLRQQAVSEKTHTGLREAESYFNVGARRESAPDLGTGPRDLPVRGVAVGNRYGRGEFHFNGEVVDYMRRPPALQGAKDAFVIWVIGDSMAPRYRNGEPAFVHPAQPPQIGDDVLVELEPTQEGEPPPAMVKELVARTATKLRLKQHNPLNERIEIDLKRVRHVYRIVPPKELYGR